MTWTCGKCGHMGATQDCAWCRRNPAPPPAVEASGDVKRTWFTYAEAEHIQEGAYARGLADAAEAIAAWLETQVVLVSGTDKDMLRHADERIAAVRSGAWRKYLEKGT